ncbi:MAG: family 16 glycoside hydrolase [Phycisphaerae bacterium]
MKRLAMLAVLVSTVLLLYGTASGVSDADVQKITAAIPDKAPAKPAKPRKLLVFNLTKGFKHDSIPYGSKALEIMGQKTGAFETTVSIDPAMFKPENLNAFDAVCLNNCSGELFTEDELKASLLDFVKGGKGFIGIHATTDCFYKWREFGEMMGGYFDGHPWNEEVGVKIDDPASPITKAFGGEGFMVKDEIYQFGPGNSGWDAYSRDRLHVLLSLDMTKTKNRGKRADQDYAVAWIHDYGKGRVFYCSLGHYNEIFWNPKILEFYLAGIQFALGDLKADTTPSAKVRGKSAAGPAALRIFAAALEPDEKGFKALFNGKDLEGWQNAGGKEPGAGWVAKDGTMSREDKAGDIWTKDRFGDFILDLEFKTQGNSGIFIRTDNIKDCVQTGIEVQVINSWGKENPNTHDCGAIYDCLAPSKSTVKENEWNRTVITCKGPKITIVMNGESIIDMDLDKWTEAHKNPDGTGNKFNKALKDFKRNGHIGLQDHDAWVAFRNIRIKPLDAAKAE